MDAKPLFDELLKIPERGTLDALEGMLKDLHARDEKITSDLSEADEQRFSALLETHPNITQMKTSGGKNLAHLLCEYPFLYAPTLTLAEKAPRLFEEKEPSLGFTPVFYLVCNDAVEWIHELKSTLEANGVKNILHAKDDNECGLAFWAAAHGGYPMLQLLQKDGVNIFEEDASGLNIFSAACLKYMQTALPDTEGQCRIQNAHTAYLEKFKQESTLEGESAKRSEARNKIIDMVRAAPKLYAPLLFLLPQEEAIDIIKNTPLPCNASAGSNPASHICLMTDFMSSGSLKSLRPQLLDRQIMGDKAANPQVVFGEQGMVRRTDFNFKSSQDSAATFLKDLHDNHLLSGEDMQINRFWEKLVETTGRDAAAHEEAKAQKRSIAPAVAISPSAVDIFLTLGADLTIEKDGRTLGDIAITVGNKDSATTLKTHADKRLETKGMQATERLKLEREQNKLSAFLSTGPSL